MRTNLSGEMLFGIGDLVGVNTYCRLPLEGSKDTSFMLKRTCMFSKALSLKINIKY